MFFVFYHKFKLVSVPLLGTFELKQQAISWKRRIHFKEIFLIQFEDWPRSMGHFCSYFILSAYRREKEENMEGKM